MELGVYIHIPFCVKKCDYCDFVSFSNKYDLQEKYVSKLIEEIQGNKELLEENDVTTIYIGGGTPSSIRPELIEKILQEIYKYSNISMKSLKDKEKRLKLTQHLKSEQKTLQLMQKQSKEKIFQLIQNYRFKEENLHVIQRQKIREKNLQLKNSKIDNPEITIEVNPGTVNKEKLQLYKNYGINRLSIGLQSTDDEILKTIGRIHNFQDFLNTYNDAIDVGFKNINVDLMIGLPGQRVQNIKESLETLMNLNPKPQHISVYSLIVEDGTLIDKKIRSGELQPPDENEERNQYWYVKNFLELNGYKHYEISNFAKPNFESKHNYNCWKQKQYIGFGLAAHSYIAGKRYSNTCNLEEYLNKNSDEIKEVHEVQTKFGMEQEYMLLGLRMLDGVSINEFKEKFVDNPIYLFRNELEKLVQENLIEIDLDNIKLTDKGLNLANIVWEEFV